MYRRPDFAGRRLEYYVHRLGASPTPCAHMSNRSLANGTHPMQRRRELPKKGVQTLREKVREDVRGRMVHCGGSFTKATPD
jgi:hypothetical protein